MFVLVAGSAARVMAHSRISLVHLNHCPNSGVSRLNSTYARQVV
jgi:hypothetical protein